MTIEPLPTLIFYEKPGCSSNAKQKALLKAVGFTLDMRNLLTEVWTATTLSNFFKSLPVADWFNKSAPKVKEGLINPTGLTAQQALALMLQEPLLIRRPLICSAGLPSTSWVGFDLVQLPPQMQRRLGTGILLTARLSLCKCCRFLGCITTIRLLAKIKRHLRCELVSRTALFRLKNSMHVLVVDFRILSLFPNAHFPTFAK